MKNEQLKKCAQFCLKEIKILTSKENIEKDLEKYSKEYEYVENFYNDFFKNNYIFIEDQVFTLKQAIFDSIDNNFISLNDLKEAKKILDEIKKISDYYYYNYIAIDKAQ
jgi:hypothetical protein